MPSDAAERTRIVIEGADVYAKMGLTMRDASGKFAAIIDGAVELAMEMFKDQVIYFLDVLVYNAPLPPSADDHPGYLERSRTGRTRDSVSIQRIGTAVGEVYVDESNYPEFFYAIVLEKGRKDIRYYPRPFWQSAEMMLVLNLNKLEDDALLGMVEAVLI